MRIVLTIIGVTIWLSACSVAKTDETHEAADLLGVLVGYADQNDLTMAEVRKELASLTWNAEFNSKGGVGRVDSDTYVDVSALENVISINGRRWTGLRSNAVQAVFVLEGEVIDEYEASNVNEGILIVFTPTHIRYFDFGADQAGKYRRAVGLD